MKNSPDSKKISSLMKVLGAPFRIELLYEIGSGEACVCHLVAVFKKRQAFISQHLMVLRDAGILTTRRDKKYIFYSISDMQIFSLLGKAGEMLGYESQPNLDQKSTVKCECPKCVEEKLLNIKN